ncbi:MAG: class II fructose-bisphosphate aldolase [Candidatus Humimicrobiaceae bacterium]
MFIPLKFMMDHAKQNGYSISRFAVTNLESIEAVQQASEIINSPIVYDVYEPELKNICQPCLEDLIKKLGGQSSVPAAIFSDHVESVKTCKEIIDKGYGGLMVDASRFPFEENIMMTREVVEYAHKRGVFIEGELGIIKSGREEDEHEKSELTDPAMASEFIRRTGADCLAVSIGVKSGFYRGTPDIDFELLKRIKNETNAHLSLHGCSGLSEEVIKKCISNGISFTAWATDVRYVFFEKIDEIRKEKGKQYVFSSDILVPARDKMRDEIILKLKQAGSDGRGSELLDLYKRNPGWTSGSATASGCFENNKTDIENLVSIITETVLKEIRNRKI